MSEVCARCGQPFGTAVGQRVNGVLYHYGCVGLPRIEPEPTTVFRWFNDSPKVDATATRLQQRWSDGEWIDVPLVTP